MQKIVGATPDGAIGPKTLEAIAGKDPKELVEKKIIGKNTSFFSTFLVV